MTDYRRAENVQIVIGKETAGFGLGDTGTPEGKKLVLAQVSGGRTQEWGDSPILRGDPFQGDPIYGMQRVQLTLRAALTIGTFPFLLKKLGTLTSNTATPVVHTGVGSTTTPDSFWLERWNADGGIVRGDRFFGCRLAGMRLSASNKGPQPLILECPIVASGDPSTSNRNQSTRYDTAPDTFDTDAVHCLKGLTVGIAGATTTLIEQIDLSIMLDQTPIDVLDGADVSQDVVSGLYVVSGKITGLLDQADTLRGYASETVPQAITLTSPTPGSTNTPIVFGVPRGFFNVDSDPDHSGHGPVRASVAFKGAYSSTSASSWYATVANSVTSYSTW